MNDEFTKGAVFVKFNPDKDMDMTVLERQAAKYKHPKRHTRLMTSPCGDFNKNGGSARAKAFRLRALREKDVDRTPVTSEERLSLGKALSEKSYS